jgi:phage terminase large subunit-like protein
LVSSSVLDQLRQKTGFIERLEKLSDAELYALRYDWLLFARPNQLAPAWDWATWMVLAGRGYGKTRVGAEMCRRWVNEGFNHVNLIAATADDLRDVMVEGESGILAVCPRHERPTYRVSKRRLEWPNGARSLLFTAQEPDRLRGKQHSKLWCFIAGTMILTDHGHIPIEDLRSGQMVSTRQGPRLVKSTGRRPALVGTVRFSNGAELTGTSDHPVLTSNGWTNLKGLSIGSCVATDTLVLTSGSEAHLESERTSISIAGSGSVNTDRSRPATTFTTEITSRRTTKSITSSVFPMGGIVPYTRVGIASLDVLQQNAISSSVFLAEMWSRSLAKKNILIAGSAAKVHPINAEKRIEPVKTAEQLSSPGPASFAASVVSTWEPAGTQIVYNLSVEETPEYFANGILVHNCDEPAAWQYDIDAWDQAQFGLRLGKNPQTVATTTPRPTKLIRSLIAASHPSSVRNLAQGVDVVTEPTVAVTRGTTYENRPNLARGFYSKIITKYENTRLGRQELLAEVLDDNPDALFKLTDIDEARVTKLPPLVRIVVAMDPATTSSDDSDEWGIIAAGQDGRDPAHFYILVDDSGIYTPDEAAKVAVRLYHRLNADRLVGEANNGGDMIEALVRHQDGNIAYKKVTASRGKVVRAEPVSALYEQRRVHHNGMFAKLEDQATNWNPKIDKDSPDRMDAMVWAMTELAEGTSGWAGFVRAEGQASPAAPAAPRVNVAGGNRDKCECGSVIWCDNAGKQVCFKCGKERPE